LFFFLCIGISCFIIQILIGIIRIVHNSRTFAKEELPLLAMRESYLYKYALSFS
jgi:hypothetical protein